MKTIDANADSFNGAWAREEGDADQDFTIVIELDESQMMQVGGGSKIKIEF